MAWTAQDAKNVSFSATSGERCWFYRYECNDTYDSKREKPTESEMSRWNYEDVNRIFGLATLTGAVCELRFFFSYVHYQCACVLTNSRKKKQVSEKKVILRHLPKTFLSLPLSLVIDSWSVFTLFQNVIMSRKWFWVYPFVYAKYI